MYSDDTSRDQNHDTTVDVHGPDAQECNAGTGTPFGLDEPCPDCLAPAGVDCDWPCSSNWD